MRAWECGGGGREVWQRLSKEQSNPIFGTDIPNQRANTAAKTTIDLSVFDSMVAWQYRPALDAVMVRLIASQRTGAKRWTPSFVEERAIDWYSPVRIIWRGMCDQKTKLFEFPTAVLHRMWSHRAVTLVSKRSVSGKLITHRYASLKSVSLFKKKKACKLTLFCSFFCRIMFSIFVCILSQPP